ncbi:MAG: hypothetical protein A2509_07890 [Candidatus Edwardsbacteria bacterium RIFOXYD12_FULL_50_11]|uniref:Zinc-ribbon domain-containing protein n=1 Tax=Candidatus Edwardsbacteria bacterium GWF2_54_11 TaxID=1817851 RepID=A0A1F5RG37_9BACT|nr:MAG: hypothetical protein A2502_12225 [Candidatus Edwardsbacteria bacterium RifOxyC12_full_54_24]OGF06591.1 MAG: hypothetical protein A2273_11930 [Candidatus Edwardsbacteria bacterium RifOxyA12_full_54_48]OGF11706.1 MAG: hypothetical protein A3K15_05160 [Candidatus Edwardsbacteria bacterium GWE2_54_12]OGF13467.1 MAG: hypothetical protein A2024_06400 [Candidatus Edwardsbacteria bacterium GWF2_54_11]OGF17908.1 MAG: hypothetical protein A2509_07890 [Candidatus Edwardsbacteria bacterium RIFOXYD1
MDQTTINLINCRECQKTVSPNARSCPHCGAPQPANQTWNGWGFDWRSKTSYYGWPLVHISVGKDRHGKLRVARGWIAIGQFGIGLITIAQFGVGILFGLGQFIFGITAVAQFAIGLLFGLGQFATGYVAIGQMALGYYAYAQIGLAKYLWTKNCQDPEAIRFFLDLKGRALALIGK